jgi:hypothetical protein
VHKYRRVPTYIYVAIGCQWLLFTSCNSDEILPETGVETSSTGLPTSSVETAATKTDVCDPYTLTTAGSFALDVLKVNVFEEPPHEQGPGVAVADLNGDGWLDVVYARRGGYPVWLMNVAGVLVPQGALISTSGSIPESVAVAAADLDGDGWQDLVLSTPRGVRDAVLYNENGTGFRVVELGPHEGERMTASIADINGDGLPDIFLGAYVHEFDPKSTTVSDGVTLYVRNTAGGYDDVTASLPKEVHGGLAFQGAWVDVDQDHDLDLYLAHDCYMDGACVLPPLLLINDGTGHFSVAENCWCDNPISAMGVAVGDANNDGFLDLLVTNIGEYAYYQNAQDGSFVYATQAAGLVPTVDYTYVSWGARFEDMNLDGNLDLLVAFAPTDPLADRGSLSAQPDRLFLGQGDGLFVDGSEAAGFDSTAKSRGLATGDITGDGLPDVVLATYDGVNVYVGAGGCPVGTTLVFSGGALVGTTVDVKVGDLSYTRHVYPSSSFSSSPLQVPLPALGADHYDQVTITWPDGTEEQLADLQVGGRVTVTRQ